MAKVELPKYISGISGKIGNLCFRTMKKSGKVYLVRLPRVKNRTSSLRESSQTELFKRRAKIVLQMRQSGSTLSQKELWTIAKQAL